MWRGLLRKLGKLDKCTKIPSHQIRTVSGKLSYRKVRHSFSRKLYPKMTLLVESSSHVFHTAKSNGSRLVCDMVFFFFCPGVKRSPPSSVGLFSIKFNFHEVRRRDYTVEKRAEREDTRSKKKKIKSGEIFLCARQRAADADGIWAAVGWGLRGGKTRLLSIK